MTTGFFANVATTFAIFMTKRMVWWPIPVVSLIAGPYFHEQFYQIHNKKFFDMCNVGEEFLLGSRRNEVLRQCNKILNCEDF